jgi:hypothetical protein
VKQVFEYLERQTDGFKRRPLFVYLQDLSVEPQARLKFAPYLAHFVMTIADFWVLLREDPPRDRYQELVNNHIGQEENHSEWFLSDLTSMDLDPTVRFTDALRFIWSDSTSKTRRVSYELCKLIGGLTSLQKLFMIYSIEATARVSFQSAVPAARQLEATTGRRLTYLGLHHLDAELHHTVESQAIHQSLQESTLADPVRAELRAVIDTVFRHFVEFVDETFLLATR